MSDLHDSYGNMNIDTPTILLVLLHKFSPHVPVELTQADYDAVSYAFKNGPALSSSRHQLAGVDTLTFEVLDAEEARRIAAINGFRKR